MKTKLPLYGIGDIHGMYEELLEVLDAIEADAPDGAEIVMLGDYIDRGYDSKGVLDLLMAGPRRPQDTWITLKGNHESIMIAACTATMPGPKIFWRAEIVGGTQTMDSFGGEMPPMKYVKWANDLPIFHETAKHIFVHAGCYPSTPMDQQPEEHLIWMRDWEDNYLEPDAPKFSKHVVYGHTPSKEVRRYPFATCLDTGAGKLYATLTAARFNRDRPTGPLKLFQVKCPAKRKNIV